MNIHDAAKICYADNPRLLRNLELMRWMDCCEVQWHEHLPPWEDDTFHAVWWALHALAHNDPKALVNAHAYLELAKGRIDDAGTGAVDSGAL